MVDILIAVWVAAVGISFAILPLLDSGGAWIGGVWDAWRFIYGAAMLLFVAVGGVRAYRRLPAPRRLEK